VAQLNNRVEMCGDAMCGSAKHISSNLFAQIEHFC
jgi:hypothetical protein